MKSFFQVLFSVTKTCCSKLLGPIFVWGVLLLNYLYRKYNSLDLTARKQQCSNVWPNVFLYPLQGAAERFGSWETTLEELLSLLSLQKRHVECSEQENSKGITLPIGPRMLNLPAHPLCVCVKGGPVGAHSLPELCLFLNRFLLGTFLFWHQASSYVCLGEENETISENRGCTLHRQTWFITLPL